MKRTLLFMTLLTLILGMQEAHSQSLRQMVKKKLIQTGLETQAKTDSV